MSMLLRWASVSIRALRLNLKGAVLSASLVVTCSVTDAAQSPPGNPSPTLHGYFWKETALILPAGSDGVKSVAIEDNAGTSLPPLAAIGGPGGVRIYAFKSILANYPPAWFAETQILPGGQVSLWANRLAVGTPDNGGGHVRVYERSASGTWSPMGPAVFAPPQIVAEEFGRSVDLEGQTMVVGMPNNLTGKAYVFELQGGAWVQTAELGLEPGIAVMGSYYGSTVSVEGDFILVGQLPPGAPGRVHVYHEDGGAWSVIQTLTARDPANPSMPAPAADLAAAEFGKTFTLSGTRLAVRSNSYLQMFERPAAGNQWAYTENFTVGPTIPPLGKRDLRSVAFDGKNLLIGEPLATKNAVVAGRCRVLLGTAAYMYYPYSSPYIPPPDNSLWEKPLEADVGFGHMTAVDTTWLVAGDIDHARVYRKTAF